MSSETMQAVVLEKTPEGPGLVYRSVPRPTPGPGQAQVSLHAAALNRRDVWIRLGRYAQIKLPSILGSDGAGVVSSVGEGVSPQWIGKSVVLNPALTDNPSPDIQGSDYRILGMPEDGTYAESIVVSARRLVDMPAHLSFVEAAALPLAGVTAYRSLCVRGQVRPGQTVLIPGIGSGVSTLTLLFALHLGAKVVVTSGSHEKLAMARQLGASFGVSYHDADWDDQIAKFLGGANVDVVVDGAGADAWAKSLKLLRPGGRLVSYGATAGLPQIDLRKVFWRQLQILGSTMGNESEFAEMVALVAAGKLRPLIDQVYPLASAQQAHLRMEHSQHMGKLVLQIRD
ncbi:MAG TPA: zinc-binding dehydrogenase [Pseudomonadota bacterium]|nr:zinc-binding dehydrogenase [Pseudomonadota bacterium]